MNHGPGKPLSGPLCKTWKGDVLRMSKTWISPVVPSGPCTAKILFAIPSPSVSCAATRTGALLLGPANAAKPPSLGNVAVTVSQAHTSTLEPPAVPAPTTISGIRSALILATLSDKPPLNVGPKGTKLCTSVGAPVTSNTFTAEGMPAPLPTIISAFPSKMLTNVLPTIFPMSAAPTTPPLMKVDGKARKFW